MMTITVDGKATVVVDDAHLAGSLVDVKTAAQLIGCNLEVCRRWIRQGRLPATKRGRSYFVALSDIRAERNGEGRDA